MDDSDEETRYAPKHYSMTRQAMQSYSSSSTAKPPKRNPHFYAQYRNDVGLDEDEDDDEVDEDEDTPEEEFNHNRSGYVYSYNDESKRHPKKRKLGELVSNYEFAPRAGGSHPGGSSRRSGWSEEESFVLLEVWGERYLELGRRSLRGEDWVDVAEKVSEMTGVEREVMDCRSQMDVLKKKYKKERVKMEQLGGGFLSKWVFFKKMDVLLNLKMRGHGGLGCGVDSGEYVFMNPHVYLDRSNVLDEMRDSPAESDEDDEEDNGTGGEGEDDDNQSAKLLAESIRRFGEIYEKIETSKRKQMMELEKMRMDFQRELEMQKKEIVDRAQAEIARLREMEDEDYDEDEDNDDNDDGDDDDDDAGSMENLGR